MMSLIKARSWAADSAELGAGGVLLGQCVWRCSDLRALAAGRNREGTFDLDPRPDAAGPLSAVRRLADACVPRTSRAYPMRRILATHLQSTNLAAVWIHILARLPLSPGADLIHVRFIHVKSMYLTMEMCGFWALVGRRAHK